MPSHSALRREIITKANKMANTKAISLKANPYLETGTQDVMICRKSRLFMVEVKTGEARTRKIQERRAVEWASAGAVCLVARSWQDVEAALLGPSTGFGGGI